MALMFHTALVGTVVFVSLTLGLGRETMPTALGYVDASDAMPSVAESLVPLASSAGLDLVVNGTDGCGSAWVDRDDLIGVLVNVVGNAIKFTPRGGSVMLAVEEQDGDCVVTVCDTGIGIPDSDHGRVFDRFFRSKTSNTDAVPGTGLGLAIASELIERNGGRISLRWSVGVGSTVTIRLPVAEHDARL